MSQTSLSANESRLFFAVGNGEPDLRVYRFESRETMSQPYEVALDLISPDPELDLAGLVGSGACLEIVGPLAPRYYHGIVAEFEQISVGRRFSAYKALLVPAIWLLNHRWNCRIFQPQAFQAIVNTILDELGLPGDQRRFALTGSHPDRDYCVQYRESDLNFIQRLFEDEGIFYFFEHTQDKHVLVMADNPAAHPSIPGGQSEIAYHEPRPGQVPDEIYIHDIRLRQAIRGGKVTLRSYNFKKPQLNLEGEKTAAADVKLEHYDYPADFELQAHGGARAEIRLQERRAASQVLTGASPYNCLAAGHYFNLDQHPRELFNRRYLLTECRQQGEQPQVYEEDAAGGTTFSTAFSCIPFDVPYRPPRITPKPRVQGSQTALVVGPRGEEIYTDEHGRVKVQFHWDREGQWDEKSSCWIRVGQGWAGPRWGTLMLPRIGQEVIVDFLDGDPDRPIITGGVYHATNKPPYTLPDEKTKSTIKSDSTKGGGGFNEFRFEDKKNDEQVFIHAEKDLDLRIKNDRIEWVGHSRHLIVTQDKLERIDHERHEKVAADHLEQIGKDRHLKVAGKQAIETGGSHSLTVKGDMIESFNGNHSEQTAQNYYLKAAGIVIESMSGITLKCGGNSVVIDQTGVTLKGTSVTIDGSMVKLASGPGSPAASGSAGSAVSPAAPTDPLEADIAEPGLAVHLKEQQAARRESLRFVPFKHGASSPPAAPASAPASAPARGQTLAQPQDETTWIEIVLVDEADEPVPGERYEITVPDGRMVRGTLDQKGFARVEGIKPGECTITFPRLDQEAWQKI